MRSGRKLLLLAFLCCVGFAALGIYHYLNVRRYQANAALLRELQSARFPESTPARIGDWPGWRGPMRDGVSRETGLMTDWPGAGPPVVWQAPVGRGYSSMAVTGGRVFTQFQEGLNAVVIALDAETGRELWRFHYPCAQTGDPTYGPCPRSTPTVDGDRVYVAGGNGHFHCLDVESGTLRWQKNFLQEFGARLPQWGMAFSPLIEGDLVVTHPGAPGRSVIAFKKFTGQLVWQAGDDPAGYSSPIAADLAGQRQLLMFTGKALLGLSLTGEVMWRFPWETSYDCNVATPIIRGDYVLLSSGYGKGCALLKATPGWLAPTVTPVYEHNELCTHFSSCVLVGEHIYGFSDTVLKCMEFRSGDIVWKRSGLGRGSLLAADGLLYVLGENGQLVLAEATPQRFRERSSFRFSKQRCWSVPVLAQGKLYVRDEEKLVCYDLKRP
jgi:outer membrane protein assembly factor BamB